MVDQFRALGCTRLSIAFREPYDWEALEAFAEIVRPVDRRAPVRLGASPAAPMLDRARPSPYRCVLRRRRDGAGTQGQDRARHGRE
jgi:hypothetical protein